MGTNASANAQAACLRLTTNVSFLQPVSPHAAFPVVATAHAGRAACLPVTRASAGVSIGLRVPLQRFTPLRSSPCAWLPPSRHLSLSCA